MCESGSRLEELGPVTDRAGLKPVVLPKGAEKPPPNPFRHHS